MNNTSVALNILSIPHNTEKISHVYKSEFNKTREKQVTLLMITDGQKQHYTAVNSLLKDKNKCSEHFCLTCFKKIRTKLKLKQHQTKC